MGEYSEPPYCNQSGMKKIAEQAERIAMLEKAISLSPTGWRSKDARISSLEETVAKAFLRCQALEEAVKPFADFGANVDENGWTSNIHREPISTWFGPSDFRKAALCHADPVPGCETSSAEGPPQSGDSETGCDCHLYETQVCDICQGIAR